MDLEFFKHRVAKRPLGQHSFNGDFERTAWKLILHLTECRFRDAARITGVPEILFVFGLIARDANLVGVNHHDEITGIDVGRELCLVFTTQVMG